ncbi:MAG: GGDEF domain-containing protein [Vicinamibacterales bacterium]
MSESRTDLADSLRSIQATLRRRLGRADVLTQMYRAVNASLDPERVGEELVGQMAEWLPMPAWVAVTVDDTGRVRALGMAGLTPETEHAAKVVGALVIRTGAVFCCADLTSDRRLPTPDTAVPAIAAVSLPLDCRGRTVGALVGFDQGPAGKNPKFAPPTLSALLSALEPGATALDNALRVQRAEALSVTDDLTQLYNSRYLSQVLRRETKRASRSGRPLSLLFIDLDGFKAVNDTYGHLAGSRALVEAAAVIKVSARETDMVARFGGDEFAIVLPETTSEGAMAVGERVRERIAAHHFLQGEGFQIALTVSVGVATLPDVSISADGLIHAADSAMYFVKDRGKNGIHVAG